MAIAKLGSLKLNNDILTSITSLSGIWSDESGQLSVKVDGQTIGFTEDGSLSAAGGSGPLPDNIATKVILEDTTYQHSNILSDFTLTMADIGYPTQNELWTALSTIINVLGGKIIQAE